MPSDPMDLPRCEVIGTRFSNEDSEPIHTEPCVFLDNHDGPHAWMIREQQIEALQRPAEADVVNHPPHYTGHASGIECIQVTEHMNFCIGNAVKYLWRAGSKGDPIEDLRKAAWYINREIERLAKGAPKA